MEDHPLTKNLVSKLKDNLHYLRRILFKWGMLRDDRVLMQARDKHLVIEYLNHKHDYYEEDQFNPSFELLENLETNYERIIDCSIIYKSFELIREALWPLRFNKKFIARLNDLTFNQVLYVLGFVSYLAKGNFHSKEAASSEYGHVKPIHCKVVPFNRYFSCRIFKEKNVIVQIGVEKVPVIKNGIIKRY